VEIRGLRCHFGVRLLTTPISSFVIARAPLTSAGRR
jgi:hypothetical protein